MTGMMPDWRRLTSARSSIRSGSPTRPKSTSTRTPFSIRSRVENGVRVEVDLGLVGEPERIDDRALVSLRQSGIIPVIAPIGYGADGGTYNINSDTVAGAVAAVVKAQRLLLLTDV